jgi:thioredoxin reductase (NADPH)
MFQAKARVEALVGVKMKKDYRAIVGKYVPAPVGVPA